MVPFHISLLVTSVYQLMAAFQVYFPSSLVYVPQDSISGPLLFLININNLFQFVRYSINNRLSFNTSKCVVLQCMPSLNLPIMLMIVN